MGYGVTWIEAPEVKDTHLGVWERNLSLPVSARRRFEWLYRDNPAGPGRLAVLESRTGAETAAAIVGTAGYGTRAVRLRGETRPGAVLADMAVDRAHRTAMPAIMLAREVRREVLARCHIVYAFPNEHAA